MKVKSIDARWEVIAARGFQLEETPGHITITLHKPYNEDESIRVEFEAQDISDDENDLMRIFDVIITRKSIPTYYVVTSCTFSPEFRQLSVRNVKSSDSPLSQDTYDGPHLFKLRQSMQVRIQSNLNTCVNQSCNRMGSLSI